MEIIELGNRRWRILETGTLEHMIWMDGHVSESGVGRMLQEASAKTPEAAGEYAGRIWEQISKSGKVFAFLAGMLIPETIRDVDWTPQEAEQTITFLKKLTAPEDLARIRALLVSVVLGFFGVAARSSRLSGIALEGAGAAGHQLQ